MGLGHVPARMKPPFPARPAGAGQRPGLPLLHQVLDGGGGDAQSPGPAPTGHGERRSAWSTLDVVASMPGLCHSASRVASQRCGLSAGRQTLEHSPCFGASLLSTHPKGLPAERGSGRRWRYPARPGERSVRCRSRAAHPAPELPAPRPRLRALSLGYKAARAGPAARRCHLYASPDRCLIFGA